MGIIHDRIKEMRLASGLTLSQVAAELGVEEATVQRYESGNIKNIKAETLEKLAELFHCNPAYLAGWVSHPFVPLKASPIDESFVPLEIEPLSPSEEDHIKKYRALDSHGKEMVDFTLLKEWERSTVDQKQEDNSAAQDNVPTARIINYYYRLASAGTGQIVFDMPPTKRITIPNIPEYKRVDYAIGVNGNSMEPVYHDGDTLLVEMTDEIDPGDIGIFLVDNESYVKKLGDGNLISLNPEYHDIPLTEESLCMGKVVAKF